MIKQAVRAASLLLVSALAVGGASFANAASTASLVISAVIPSKNVCSFGAGAMALNFGSINPAAAVDATASATKSFTCNGSAPLATFFISAGDGLYSTGPGARRMRHATLLTEFMAYSLTVSPGSATVPKGVAQTLTVTGTIQPSQFLSAQVGAFQDSVVISLQP